MGPSYLVVRQIDAEENRRYIEQTSLLRRTDGVREYGHIRALCPVS